MCNKDIRKIKDITPSMHENLLIADENHPNTEFKNINLKWGLLVRLGMKDSKVHDCIFRHCTFEGCYFRNTQFRNINFTGSFFKNCNLSKATFEACCFWYVQFSHCYIEYDEVLRSIPPESNISIPLLQSLRQNAIEMGEKRVADKILMKEIQIQKNELVNQILSRTSYYKNRYDMFERIISSLKLLGYLLEGFIWGYGLKLKNLLFSGILVIFAFGFLIFKFGCFAFNGNPEVATELSFGQSLYLSTITFTTLGYGDFIPISSVSYSLCAIESFIVIIFLGFLAATVYRKFSR